MAKKRKTTKRRTSRRRGVGALKSGNMLVSIGGVLAAVGSYLVNSQTGTLNLIGQIAQVIGIFLVGAMAQDAVSKKS